MNTINTDENSRPFGFWLKAVDRLMAVEFAAAFESEGITRREWRLLNVIDGTVSGEPRKSDRPLPEHKLGRLIELGWVADAEGTWTLTDNGRAAKERLGGIVDGIRAKVTDAVPTADLATTMATLEQIARAFGWDESTPLPRPRGGRRGGFTHGHGFRSERGFRHGHGFGNDRRGFGPGRHGFGHAVDGLDRPSDGPHPFVHEGHGMPGMGESDECAHGRPHGRHGGRHARARFARFAQGAYERGFDAGFTRGRDDR